MERDGEGLLRIGLFSRLTAISIRMLRHYQEQRVLEPAMTVAALRRVLPSYEDEGTLWQEIGPLMERSGTHMSGHDEGIGGATFHDPEYRETDVDIEVWLQVKAPFTLVAPLECREIPAREVVVARLQGSYDGMSEVTAALGTYIAARTLSAGPMFNIYWVGPVQNPDPSAWVTDVCFPIEGH